MAKLLTDRPKNLSEYPNSFKRQGAFPIDSTNCWYSLTDAQEYAKNDATAYVGQIISVMEDNTVTAYIINDEAGTLVEVGAKAEPISDEFISSLFNGGNNV